MDRDRMRRTQNRRAATADGRATEPTHHIEISLARGCRTERPGKLRQNREAVKCEGPPRRWPSRVDEHTTGSLLQQLEARAVHHAATRVVGHGPIDRSGPSSRARTSGRCGRAIQRRPGPGSPRECGRSRTSSRADASRFEIPQAGLPLRSCGHGTERVWQGGSHPSARRERATFWLAWRGYDDLPAARRARARLHAGSPRVRPVSRTAQNQ